MTLPTEETLREKMLKDIGQWHTRARKAGKKLKDVAADAGVGVTTLSNIMNYKREPTLKAYEKIEKTLKKYGV